MDGLKKNCVKRVYASGKHDVHIFTHARIFTYVYNEANLMFTPLEKKKLYKKAVEDRRGAFTPFVTSVDGLLHREADNFLNHIATSIAAKWGKSYAETCAFVRARLLFAL